MNDESDPGIRALVLVLTYLGVGAALFAGAIALHGLECWRTGQPMNPHVLTVVEVALAAIVVVADFLWSHRTVLGWTAGLVVGYLVLTAVADRVERAAIERRAYRRAVLTALKHICERLDEDAVERAAGIAESET